MTFMVFFIVLPAGDVHVYSITTRAYLENLTVSFFFNEIKFSVCFSNLSISRFAWSQSHLSVCTYRAPPFAAVS